MYEDSLDLIIRSIRDGECREVIAKRLEVYNVVSSMTGVRNVTVRHNYLAIPVPPTDTIKTLGMSEPVSVHITDRNILRALQYGTRWEYTIGKLLQSDVGSLAHNSNMGIVTLRKLHKLMLDNGWGWRGYDSK